MSELTATTLIIVSAVSILVMAMLLFGGGAYLYHKGYTRAAPLPLIDRITNPPAKEPEVPKPVCPYKVCPFCKKQPKKWLLAVDESVWTCSTCENVIAGPKPRINA